MARLVKIKLWQIILIVIIVVAILLWLTAGWNGYMPDCGQCVNAR